MFEKQILRGLHQNKEIKSIYNFVIIEVTSTVHLAQHQEKLSLKTLILTPQETGCNSRIYLVYLQFLFV